MWIATFKFNGSELLFGKAAKIFNVNLTGYPLSSYEKNKNLFLNIVGTIKGKDKNTAKFLEFLKKNKSTLNLESHNNFLNVLIQEDGKYKPFYSPFFVYLSPIKIDNAGFYYYQIGSWQREKLTDLLNFVEKYKGYKLLGLKQKMIQTISILGIQPNLTEKQRKAYELAVKEGYYEYPKKIKIENLAKISGISYSTFQQHLKYAEKKISEFFTGKY